jgi:hypothetical protein
MLDLVWTGIPICVGRQPTFGELDFPDFGQGSTKRPALLVPENVRRRRMGQR